MTDDLIKADFSDLENRIMGYCPRQIYYSLGHSHVPSKPVWWKRLWLRLRGKWPLKYQAGTIDFETHDYNTGPSEWGDGYVRFDESGRIVKEFPWDELPFKMLDDIPAENVHGYRGPDGNSGTVTGRFTHKGPPIPKGPPEKSE